MSNYKQPLTAEDLKALVDYVELALCDLPFPVTAVERARWEIRRLDNQTQNK